MWWPHDAPGVLKEAGEAPLRGPSGALVQVSSGSARLPPAPPAGAGTPGRPGPAARHWPHGSPQQSLKDRGTEWGHQRCPEPGSSCRPSTQGQCLPFSAFLVGGWEDAVGVSGERRAAVVSGGPSGTAPPGVSLRGASCQLPASIPALGSPLQVLPCSFLSVCPVSSHWTAGRSMCVPCC